MTTATPAEPVTHGDHRCYWRGCRLPECTAAASARGTHTRYMLQTGRGTICRPDLAARHIHKLRDAGMPDTQIKAAARIGDDTLYRIINRTSSIRRSTEQRVLSIPITRPFKAENCSKADAAGARRRLQALAVAGWPEAAMAARMGVEEKTVRRALTGNALVSRRTLAKVRALFAEVWNKRPEDCGVLPVSAKRARLLAERHGWHPVGAWDDIDDPNEEPQYGERASRVEAVIEDTAELAAQGYSREAISARLGITWGAIRRVHARKGVQMPELPE